MVQSDTTTVCTCYALMEISMKIEPSATRDEMNVMCPRNSNLSSLSANIDFEYDNVLN